MSKNSKDMEFIDQITEDIKSAMKARDHGRLEALRGIKKELLEARTAKGAGDTLAEADVMKVLQRMVKQRRESAAIYQQQDRSDLAEVELAEAEVIGAYLPKALTPEELEAAVREAIAQTGAASPKDMGRVMGVVNKQLAGRAEGRDISDCVKRLLAGGN